MVIKRNENRQIIFYQPKKQSPKRLLFFFNSILIHLHLKNQTMLEISVQYTENPKVIKFIASKTLLEGSLELDRNSDISHIPLAKELFNFPFITRIFITANFIAIAKEDSVEWDLISDNLKNIITENLHHNPKIILPKNEKIIFYTERTPNPEVVKFVSDQSLIEGFLEIKSNQDAKKTPLAKKLFEEFDFIKEIFINDNYIAITKIPQISWDSIMDKIQNSLEKLFEEEKMRNIEGIHETKQAQSFNNRNFTETEEKINAIILEYIAPAVENDGGKISLIEFDENTKTAKMLLQGACSGCPSSTITLKMGIEGVLKNFLPDVVESVEAING